MNPVIRLNEVTAGYERGKPVIRKINLLVEDGDFLAVIGPNGGGKTTLLNVMLGLLEPWEGTVEILGTSPKYVRGKVGYVPQVIPGKSFPITVMDVVLMGRLIHAGIPGRFTKKDREIAVEKLNLLGIANLAQADMNLLSGGQKQRVLIARALAGDPRILLLDEPVASVDSTTQESFYNLLVELNHRMTIIMVTHDVGAISAHVKNIACINGTLTGHGAGISGESVSRTYGCPFELISHGPVPHRVLGGKHSREED